MAATFKGVTYPTSSDNIAPLETHFQNLAEKADAAGVWVERKLFTGPSATGSTVDVTVLFSTAFPSAPKVSAVVEGGSGMSVYAVSIAGAPTTTGFVARVFRCNGSTAETDLQLVWSASTFA